MNPRSPKGKGWPHLLANLSLGNREWRDVRAPDSSRGVYSGPFSCDGGLATRKRRSFGPIGRQRVESKPFPGRVLALINGNKTIQGETTA